MHTSVSSRYSDGNAGQDDADRPETEQANSDQHTPTELPEARDGEHCDEMQPGTGMTDNKPDEKADASASTGREDKSSQPAGPTDDEDDL